MQGLHDSVPDSVGAVGPLVNVERAEAGGYHMVVVGEQEARHVVLHFEFTTYRASHVLVDWVGWVDLNFKCSTVCPILSGLMGIWQKWLGRWVTAKSKSTQPRSKSTLDTLNYIFLSR